jgi:hypothetical protein
LTFTPGQRGYAGPDDIVLPAYDDGDGWFVDAITRDGQRDEQGHFERLDLCYFYGHLIALARARTVRQGLRLSPIVAITAADMVYLIAELTADESMVHTVDETDDIRNRAHVLAVTLLAARQGRKETI